MINYSRITAHGARRTNQGFSLVELIFSIVLLSIIVFGVISLQTSNLTLTNTQRNELQAHFLANQDMEIVEAIGYTEFSNQCPGGTCYCTWNASYSLTCSVKTPPPPPPTPDPIDTTFGRVIDVEESGLTSGLLVIAKIIWTDSSGEHSVEAKRIIFN